MNWRKHPDKIREQANAFKRGENERAQMEKQTKPRIKMLSGFYGNEKYVQNIWIVLPVEMERTEFKERLRRGFSDVGEI